MGSCPLSVRLVLTVVTAISSVTMFVALSLSCLLVVSSVSAFPQQLPPGVDAASCPNFPFCGPSPTGAGAAPSANTPALQAHAAAEAAVRAQQAQGPGLVGPSGK